jgi:hypothetical protein
MEDRKATRVPRRTDRKVRDFPERSAVQMRRCMAIVTILALGAAW